MSDDNVISMLGGNKPYRRKRRYQGATWTPASASALKEDGVWCPVHRKRHGYMSKELLTNYEKGSDGRWKLMWICKLTGNVIKEEVIGDGTVRLPEG